MKIAVCSLHSGEKYKEKVYLCVKSLEIYCEKRGYPLIKDESFLGEREPMWNKILLLEKYLPDYDYIVWIDADMLIMNTDYTLEHFITYYMRDKDIMMAIDSGDQINTGTMFLKNSEYTRELLSIIYNLPELAGDYHEQGVFNRLYERNFMGLKDHSEIIPEPQQRIFNASIYTYHYGDFLIHFLGVHKEEWLGTLMNDHYPYQKDGENKDMYDYRMKWVRDKYTDFNLRYSYPERRMKICVCTLMFGDKYAPDVVKYGRRSLELYTRKHNYDLIIEDKLLDTTLPAHWSKLLLMSRLLRDKSYDYIVWMDADVLICNHHITLGEIIHTHMDGKTFLLTRDISNHINTGVWFVKRNEYAKKLLEINYKLPELRYRGYEDQDVLNRIHERNILNFQENSVILGSDHQHIFNCCIGLYKPGTFLVHFFSLSKEGLQQGFNDFYPFKKDEEMEEVYEDRMKWVENR